MDFRGHMETRQREGLRATGDEGAGKYSEADPINLGKHKGRQKKEGRDSGKGGGDSIWGGPAKSAGGLEKSERVVQGCGQMCAAARSSVA